MSIYFNYESPKSGYWFRRAVEDDKHDIELIIYAPDTRPLFGDVNIGSLIELSALSICMINKKNRVVGFIAFSDYPNVHGVDPADWEYWIRNLYQRYYVSRSTLFVHFMCCADIVTDIFLEEALISVFLSDSYVTEIVIVVPTSCPEDVLFKHGAFKKHNCYKFLPRGKEDKFGNYLIVAGRKDFCPKLKMRRAVEEDNDDVVKILDKSCPRLKELYGLYYISELIGRHPESQRQILVGDVQGRAVAVMCLNTDINYRQLQKIYDLKPFNGLSSSTPLEKEQNKRANKLLTVFGDPIRKGKWLPFQHLQNTSSFHSISVSEGATSKSRSHRMLPTKKSSKVNFKRNAKRNHSLDRGIIKQNDSDDLSDRIFNFTPNPSQSALVSVANMLDDDPFDYDIVNIDQKWLQDVPSNDVSNINVVFGFKNTLSVASLRKPNSYKWKKKNLYKKQLKSIAILDQKISGTYHGPRNAFMIELFAMREDIDERHAFDMLEAAFDLMKDYDYCIIRIPCTERHFPLLQHFCYIPVRNRVCCEYCLYVAHRSSVLGKLRVREAEMIDIPNIAHLLYPLDAKDTMNAIETMIKENQAYVFTSGMSIVGIAILELPEEIDFLRCRFNLDAFQLHKYRYEGHGIGAGFMNIKTIIAYPVFEPHFRFFTRDLMRLSGSNTLMYVSAYRNKWAVHKLNVTTSSMIPLIPREVEIDSETVPELNKIATMLNEIVPFSAWFINRKFTTLSKVNITTKIVIIGGSRTCLGFMKALLFEQPSTYITFTNVTLISPFGLPYIRHAKPVAESMFLRYYTSSNKYLKSVPYTYYINVIQGKMAEINLQEKYVILTSGNKCHYDLLFLFLGKQYQHPNYMEHLLERDLEKQRKPEAEYFPLDAPRYSDTELQITCDDTPRNVFIINHIIEAQKALDYIKQLSWNGDAKVIVYGATVKSYLCINALLTINVPPENIIFIEPFPSENPVKTRVPEFSNENVDLTIKEVLNNLKITVYRSYYFVTWIWDDTNNYITHAEFISHSKYLRLKCCALFYYGKIGIDMRAFVAIHKSGLSYDGGIVINDECCTRDPSVYAAGPHTRYLRRYYADAQAHKYYDSYEIGFKLGTRIRQQLDPLFKEATPDGENCPRKSSQKSSDVSFYEHREIEFVKPNLMELNKPKVKYCVLPGGLKYLEVRSPGLKLPHYYLQSLKYNGYVMETFKKGYFQLHLSKELYVDSITCLSPCTFSLEKFKYLYGQSATVLKNVHIRFSTNKLDDFYEFFEAPWAFFLYHDQIDDLFAMSKELFPKNQSTGCTIKEALQESLKDSESLTYNLKKSPYVEVITDYVIDWLSNHDILLPMYLQPSNCTQYTHDLGTRELFKARKDKDGEGKS